MSTREPNLLLSAPLKAMKLVGTTKRIRRLGKVVFFMLLIAVPGIIFLPWLQTTAGTGKVIAFDPLKRSSEIQAQVSGRVRHLYVVEGQTVEKGDLIAEIEDNDPNLLMRIEMQLTALNSNLQSSKDRQGDLAEKLKQKEEGIKQAFKADTQKLEAAEAILEFTKQDFLRKEKLNKDGIIADVDLQKALAEMLKAQAKVGETKASRDKTQNEIAGDIADIKGSINKGLADISKIEKDIADLESKQSKSERLSVTAPRDGIVTAIATNDGEYLKPGSPICTLVPETDERFIEMTVSGNYIPLLRARELNEDGEISRHGSLVRIQFEGWPAVQFSGWPSVAVGTFGGEVVFIDRQDNGMGQFRVIVAPEILDEEDADRQDLEWPEAQYLRQGARAKAWVQIRQVPLWRELWRRFNGFPPALQDKEEGIIRGEIPKVKSKK